MKRRAAMILVLLLVGVARADAADPRKVYQKARKEALTRAGYGRFEKRLAEVKPGMNQSRLFATLGMLVLAHQGKPVEATVDGYLRAEGAGGAPLLAATKGGELRLVFGYKLDGQEIEKVAIILRANRVAEIEEIEPGLLARLHLANSPSGS